MVLIGPVISEKKIKILIFTDDDGRNVMPYTSHGPLGQMDKQRNLYYHLMFCLIIVCKGNWISKYITMLELL
jgi:hypothetical protein